MIKEIIEKVQSSKELEVEINVPLGYEVRDKIDCIEEFISELEKKYSIEVEEYGDYEAEVYVRVSGVKFKELKKFVDELNKKYQAKCDIYGIIREVTSEKFSENEKKCNEIYSFSYNDKIFKMMLDKKRRVGGNYPYGGKVIAKIDKELYNALKKIGYGLEDVKIGDCASMDNGWSV